MDSPISIDCSEELDDNHGNPVFYLTIRGHDCWEMNILMTQLETALIPNVRQARWSERTCLHIGKCAGVQTCWSCEDGNLSILVGRDDECWQFGVLIPEAEIENIITAIEREA